ncbi:CBS domain-containing protein [Dichotomicrobium thermohalophilum]|uniref:CBS domain-containing protein n=1 Tax=Dichotomicrobium thermohalophilum TaxID=933063 RepID=A0A397P7F3_9HYPH|nr:CBS domain-containing protein [Dichotomicrobium thermohalophilum]RIA45470.1 CBS domain-containing protein [Dichotomicrobium thermohalophilum]
MKVREAMSSDTHVIDPNTTIRDACQAMREDNIGCLPVCENDRLIGMVTDRDIAMRAVATSHAPGTTSVRTVMSDHIFYCYDDVELEEAARRMAEHQVHRLPVINRDKRLVGMLALADLARKDPDALKTAFVGIAEPTDQPRR